MTAAWSLPCDYCPAHTTDPTWCSHQRVTCAACADSCRDCQREARSR